MLQEAADVATLNAEGSLGPNERQRRLRWPERLRITQSSLATQVRGPPRMAITSSLVCLHLSLPTGLQGAGRVTQDNCSPKQCNVSGKLLVFLSRQSLVVLSYIISLIFSTTCLVTNCKDYVSHAAGVACTPMYCTHTSADAVVR